MTNQELLQIALQQSAIDCNCKPEDFLQNENIVTESRKHPSARSYLPLPFACDLVSYGNNIVAQVREDLRDTVKDYINTYPPEHCFETPNMQVLEEKLAPYGLQICLWQNIFCRILPAWEPIRVNTRSAYCIRRIFSLSICRSGAMRSVRTEKKKMSCVSVLTTGIP